MLLASLALIGWERGQTWPCGATHARDGAALGALDAFFTALVAFLTLLVAFLAALATGVGAGGGAGLATGAGAGLATGAAASTTGAGIGAGGVTGGHACDDVDSTGSFVRRDWTIFMIATPMPMSSPSRMPRRNDLRITLAR